MHDRRAPSDKVLSHDADTLQSAAGGPIDVAIVLGSGLSESLSNIAPFDHIPYDRLLGMPIASLIGHKGEVLVGMLHGKRVAALAGRVHLYQGFSAHQITVTIRLARAAGAKTLILTNASGTLNPGFAPGDLMLITDQLNLTGANPLIGSANADRFVDMLDAYSPHLRDLASAAADHAAWLRHGVYAGVLGPTYETPAEARYLRTIGADAVGMSTVLEAIAARANGMDLLGISLITNRAGDETTTTALDVTAVAASAAPRLAALVDGVIARM
ncbi:MAG: purine-nucleoside phosphorylase [Vulcanimicrobiaceae bacterium]